MVFVWPIACGADRTAAATIATPNLAGSLRRLPKMSIYDLFRELDAVVAIQVRRLLQPAIERHPHLPWTREDVRIFDRGFVHQRVAADRRETFGDLQGVAVKVSGA